MRRGMNQNTLNSETVIYQWQTTKRIDRVKPVYIKLSNDLNNMTRSLYKCRCTCAELIALIFFQVALQ